LLGEGGVSVFRASLFVIKTAKSGGCLKIDRFFRDTVTTRMDTGFQRPFCHGYRKLDPWQPWQKIADSWFR